MQNNIFEKLTQAFEHSPIPFALLDSELHVISLNAALSSRYPNIKDPVNLYYLLSDVDKDTILNYLKSEKAYELIHDLPDQKAARIIITALFDQDDEEKIIGATAVIPTEGAISKNVFSAADDNECQTAVNRELRDRITMMFTALHGLSNNNDIDKSPAVCEYINSIHQNCFQLLRISDNLSKVMRLSAQNDYANFHLVDLSAFFRKLITTVIHLDNKNRIPITFSCPDEIVSVKLDQERMEFALVNILLNAIKYTRDGNEIDISLCCVGKNAIIRISDKGVGIPKDILPLVGTAYFSYSHGDRFEAGFGIGLYIAKKYIASHGGSLAIQSVEGEGTTVTISIPIDFEDESDVSKTQYFKSPPPFSPQDKFSQTRIQLSEVCYYPTL